MDELDLIEVMVDKMLAGTFTDEDHKKALEQADVFREARERMASE